MLQSHNPIDELFALSDTELLHAVKKGDFPYWVHEYVDFILGGGFQSEEKRVFH